MSLCDELPADWRNALAPWLGSCPLDTLSEFIDAEYSRHVVFPPRHQLFRAFADTPLDCVKVVILGQDPYHEPGQACGLAFAVPDGMKRPASLRNIFKEYSEDLGTPVPAKGNLAEWSRRGVLMLNTVLSVRKGQAGSHQNQGWEAFTDAVIRCVSAREKPVVFVLWGRPAAMKEPLIDLRRHKTVKSAHPSPLSAYRGFFGSRPFTAVNRALAELGEAPVDWHLE